MIVVYIRVNLNLAHYALFVFQNIAPLLVSADERGRVRQGRTANQECKRRIGEGRTYVAYHQLCVDV
jgi:hypothetical protein